MKIPDCAQPDSECAEEVRKGNPPPCKVDTADEVGTLEQCLYSTGQRVKIAQFLVENERYDILPTVLEDLFYGVQMLLDEHCIMKEET